jgi:AcrR family transcriptional regulator
MHHKTPFGRGDRRGYHHGSLKDALLEAARSLLAERGPAGFTLAEAAKLVGVTAAAPYRHFSDRNALMSELARRGFEQFGKRLAGAWDDGRPDPQAALARMGAAYLAFSRDEPGLYTAMFNNVAALAAPDAGAPAETAIEILRTAARNVLRKRGALEGGARELALEIWSMSHGVAMLSLAGHLDWRRTDIEPDRILGCGVTALVEMAVRRGGAGQAP